MSDDGIRPTPDWATANPADVLVHHQRNGIKGCTCGWGELGKSFPEHQVVALREAGLVVVRSDDAERAANFTYGNAPRRTKDLLAGIRIRAALGIGATLDGAR